MSSPREPSESLRPLRRVRQVRQFTDEPVTDAALAAVADVGRWSGSSGNSQPWRFITIGDVALVRRIAAMDLPHSRALNTAMAAIAVIVPTDSRDAVSIAFDEGRATERMLIAATELGLGGGLMWVSSGARDAVGAVLGLPQGWMARSVLALGHPSLEAQAPKKPRGQARRPRERMVALDRWRDELGEV